MNRLPVASVLSAYALSASTLLTCTTTTLHADSILVPVGGDIQAAIDLLGDGDTVQLQAGTYPVTSTLRTDGKSLRLIGATGNQGQPLSVLDGQESVRILRCEGGDGPGATFEHLVLRNGQGAPGGAMIIWNASATVHNCVFLENVAFFLGDLQAAGAVDLFTASVRFTDCRFIENRANLGGAVMVNLSEVVLENCRFEDNQAISGPVGTGGALLLGQETTLVADNCTFIGNQAEVAGAMHTFTECSVAMTDCTFTGNDGGSFPGGVIRNTDSELTLDRCTITGNPSESTVGAIWNFDAELALTDTTICDNPMQQIEGPYTDGGGNCVREFCTQCECPADLDGNGTVDGADLTIVLSDWGCTGDDCVGDLDGSSQVDGADLTIILSAWGDCG